MADVSQHHGTRVFESDELPVLIRTAQSAVATLFVTAPDADTTEFPHHEPVMIKGSSDYRKAKKLGAAGTALDSIDAVFDNQGTYCHIINIPEGVDAQATLSNFVGSFASLTGVHALKKIESKYGRKFKGRLIAAPGYTSALSSDGITAVQVTNGGSGYTADTKITAGGDGTNTELLPLIADGVITGVAIRKPGFGFSSAPTLTVTDTGGGSGAVMTATIGTVGNPVVHELVGIMEQTRAVAFVDGPNTTDEAAIAYAGKYGSDRVYVVDPKCQVWDTELDAYVPQPMSGRFVGVQAKVDRTLGFAHSVSNKPINGIDGLTRPMSYGEQTNLLNFNQVNTAINRGDGWRTWGNRSTTGVSMWAFLNVRRTADFVNEALEDGYFEFVDKLPTLANLKFMQKSGQAFLDGLAAENQIIGGKVWFDPEKNTAIEAAQGRWTLSVEFEPYAPMEDIRLLSHRNIAYYDLLIDTIANNIQDGPLAIAA